jgi:hypothetical protein
MTSEAEYKRAKWKQYRDTRADRAAAHGLCGRCVMIPPVAGRKICVVCAEYHREIFHQRKAEANTIRHCVVCTKRRCLPGKMKCKRCAKVTAAYFHQRRMDAKAQGLCQSCVKRSAAAGKLSCQTCIDRIGASNLARKSQKACKAKEQSRIIIESTNSKHGDTNAQSTKVPSQACHESQSSQSQASRQSEGRTEGQSQDGTKGPQVRRMRQVQHRPQRSILQGLATVAVFGITFGLLIAGMLR